MLWTDYPASCQPHDFVSLTDLLSSFGSGHALRSMLIIFSVLIFVNINLIVIFFVGLLCILVCELMFSVNCDVSFSQGHHNIVVNLFNT